MSIICAVFYENFKFQSFDIEDEIFYSIQFTKSLFSRWHLYKTTFPQNFIKICDIDFDGILVNFSEKKYNFMNIEYEMLIKILNKYSKILQKVIKIFSNLKTKKITYQKLNQWHII